MSLTPEEAAERALLVIEQHPHATALMVDVDVLDALVNAADLSGEVDEQEHYIDQLREVLSGFVDWSSAYKSNCPCTNCRARTLLGDYDQVLLHEDDDDGTT